jgi:hypothetical protein
MKAPQFKIETWKDWIILSIELFICIMIGNLIGNFLFVLIKSF